MNTNIIEWLEKPLNIQHWHAQSITILAVRTPPSITVLAAPTHMQFNNKNFKQLHEWSEQG